MTKTFLMTTKTGTVQKDFTFEELYTQFFKMIQKETWSMVKVYGNIIKREEIEQQFTIELWNSYEKYDISHGTCISTYIYNRFQKAKRDLLYPLIGSSKSKWEKKNTTSLSVKHNEDDRDDQSNKMFTNDKTYNQIANAENLLVSQDLIEAIISVYNKEEDLDLILILIDKKTYSVANYAEKWGISRVAANNRLRKIKKELVDVLEDFKN